MEMGVAAVVMRVMLMVVTGMSQLLKGLLLDVGLFLPILVTFYDVMGWI